MMTATAYVQRILDTPHPDPFPAPVVVIAQAGYRASVADHPQPVPWAGIGSTERHRWLLTADFVASYRGTPDAAGIRAVRFAGYPEARWDMMGAKSRIRWVRVASEMLAERTRQRDLISA